MEIKLRSSYKTLSEESLTRMIKAKGFYDMRIKTKHKFKNDMISDTISGDKVVIDRSTSLMWHQSGTKNYIQMSGAKPWIRFLNAKNYAGYCDWRLPTIEEGASLINSKKNSDSIYIDSLFSKAQSLIMTGDYDDCNCVWYIFFTSAFVISSPDEGAWVRPVRSL